jgi:hypothetical protein
MLQAFAVCIITALVLGFFGAFEDYFPGSETVFEEWWCDDDDEPTQLITYNVLELASELVEYVVGLADEGEPAIYRRARA